jgi:hypothetical protein
MRRAGPEADVIMYEKFLRIDKRNNVTGITELERGISLLLDLL